MGVFLLLSLFYFVGNCVRISTVPTGLGTVLQGEVQVSSIIACQDSWQGLVLHSITFVRIEGWNPFYFFDVAPTGLQEPQLFLCLSDNYWLDLQVRNNKTLNVTFFPNPSVDTLSVRLETEAGIIQPPSSRPDLFNLIFDTPIPLFSAPMNPSSSILFPLTSFAQDSQEVFVFPKTARKVPSLQTSVDPAGQLITTWLSNPSLLPLVNLGRADLTPLAGDTGIGV